MAHALPPELFVVHRREVDRAPPNGSGGRVSGVYFILEGKVYPTPTLHDVLASRLVSPFPTETLPFSFDHLSFVWGGSRLAQRDVPPRTVVLFSIRRAPLFEPSCYLSVALTTPRSASEHCSTFCVRWHFSGTDAS